MNKKTKMIMIIMLIAICAFSIYQIFYYLREDNANKKLNDELKNIAITIKNQALDQNDITENKEDIIPITVDFDMLKQENKDTVRMDIL